MSDVLAGIFIYHIAVGVAVAVAVDWRGIATEDAPDRLDPLAVGAMAVVLLWTFVRVVVMWPVWLIRPVWLPPTVVTVGFPVCLSCGVPGG